MLGGKRFLRRILSVKWSYCSKQCLKEFLVLASGLEGILRSVEKNLSEGNFKFAELDLRTAKGMAPDDPRVWYCDGVVKARTARFEEALESLDKSIELGFEDNAWAHFYKGYSHYKLKDLDSAVESLEKALELGSTLELAYYYASIVYGMQGNFDKALEYVNICLEFNPEDEDYKKLLRMIQEARGG